MTRNALLMWLMPLAGSKQVASNTESEVAGASAKDTIACGRCGRARIFCKHPTCLSLFCKGCAQTFNDKQGFASCYHCPQGCFMHQASGPYCKFHWVKQYLTVCKGCGVFACEQVVRECQICHRRLCTDCLSDRELCETCQQAFIDSANTDSDCSESDCSDSDHPDVDLFECDHSEPESSECMSAIYLQTPRHWSVLEFCS